MEQTITDYKNWLTASGKELNTILNYVSRIRLFVNSTKIASPTEITTQLVVNYILDLQKKMKLSSINKHIDSINGLCKFLKLDVQMPTQCPVPDNPKEVLTKKLLDEKIDSMLDLIFPNALQVKAILYTMMFCGIRRGEMEEIHRQDFDFEKHCVKFYSPKTKNWKTVPLNDELETILQGYFASEAQESFAFNMNSIQIKYLIKRINKENLIGLHLTPHLFRHSCASYLLEKGVALQDVQKILGHKDINTTAKYCHKSENKLIDDFRKQMNRTKLRGKYKKEK